MQTSKTGEAQIPRFSVFNGLDNLIKSRYSSFDPDIIITPSKGKVFNPEEIIETVKANDNVLHFSEVLEEQVLLKYDKKQIASSLNWGVLTAYPSQHRAATDNRGELQRGGKRRI